MLFFFFLQVTIVEAITRIVGVTTTATEVLIHEVHTTAANSQVEATTAQLLTTRVDTIRWVALNNTQWSYVRFVFRLTGNRNTLGLSRRAIAKATTRVATPRVATTRLITAVTVSTQVTARATARHLLLDRPTASHSSHSSNYSNRNSRNNSSSSNSRATTSSISR